MKKIDHDLKAESALAELEEKIKQVPRNREGKIQVVPEEIRHEVVVLVRRQGLSPGVLAKRLGITATSIYGWSKKSRLPAIKKKKKKVIRSKSRASPSSSSLQQQKPAQRFKPIEVVGDHRHGGSSRSSVSAATISLTLELPGGAKVHGLTMTQLRELMMTATGGVQS